MAMLSGVNLRRRFGQREVVRGVSLELQQNEIVGLLGPNGAGKTTTFYMLTGIIKPSEGDVLLENRSIVRWPLYERARAGVSYLPQESSVFRRLTVYQNMQIIIEYTQLSRQEQQKRIQLLLEEFGLWHLRESFAMHLSGGERRRLEIARCMIHAPMFMLLDEPFAGIDPLAVNDIQGIIRGLRDRGIGVLISDHNVRETLTICDRAYLVHQGAVILNGSPDEIVANEQARFVYLGNSFTL